MPVTDELKALVDGGRVKILPMTSDTLNNRFNPIPGLKTQAVFICDDDIFAPITGIDFLFRVWQARPDSIAGFFPRIHGRKEDGSIFYEMAGVHHKYDIILTKAMMINANLCVSLLLALQRRAELTVTRADPACTRLPASCRPKFTATSTTARIARISR